MLMLSCHLKVVNSHIAHRHLSWVNMTVKERFTLQENRIMSRHKTRSCLYKWSKFPRRSLDVNLESYLMQYARKSYQRMAIRMSVLKKRKKRYSYPSTFKKSNGFATLQDYQKSATYCFQQITRTFCIMSFLEVRKALEHIYRTKVK